MTNDVEVQVILREAKSSTGSSSIVGTRFRRPVKTTARERELERSHDNDQRRVSLHSGVTRIMPVFRYD